MTSLTTSQNQVCSVSFDNKTNQSIEIHFTGSSVTTDVIGTSITNPYSIIRSLPNGYTTSFTYPTTSIVNGTTTTYSTPIARFYNSSSKLIDVILSFSETKNSNGTISNLSINTPFTIKTTTIITGSQVPFFTCGYYIITLP